MLTPGIPGSQFVVEGMGRQAVWRVAWCLLSRFASPYNNYFISIVLLTYKK